MSDLPDTILFVAAGNSRRCEGSKLVADIPNGEQVEVQGSGAKPYILKNTGGVYSCSCPAWRNQSEPIERRTCKHLRKIRGDEAEEARIGAAASRAAASAPNRATNRVATPKRASSTATEGKAPPVLLAHSWENDTDLTGWWMSEKLDGVRAYWDGSRFLSRQGNPFYAPDWFTEKLPDFPLDGELFGGRKKFQRTVSIVRRQDQSDDWKELAFVIFDAPGLEAAFEERIAHVQQYVEDVAPPYAEWLEHQPCQGVKHLREELARVEGLGGEGLMLRQPGSRYEVGRSYTLLEGEELPRRRGARHRPPGRRGPAQGPAGRARGGAAQRHPLLGGHRPVRRRAGEPAAPRQHHHLPLPGALQRWRAPLPLLCGRAHRRGALGAHGPAQWKEMTDAD